jgi:hypothetical protein
MVKKKKGVKGFLGIEVRDLRGKKQFHTHVNTNINTCDLC